MGRLVVIAKEQEDNPHQENPRTHQAQTQTQVASWK